MDFEKAKEALADLTGSAEDLLTDTGKLEALLQQLEQKLLAVPSAGSPDDFHDSQLYHKRVHRSFSQSHSDACCRNHLPVERKRSYPG